MSILSRLSVIAFFLMFTATANAQSKWYTKTGKVSFFSEAALEDIEAKNKTATAVLESTTGAVQIEVLMKGFEFEKALMQDHFNKSYVESDKYPKASFKGTIVNNAAVSYGKDGSYAAKVKGKFTLHGVTKDIEVPITIKKAAGKLEASSTFNLLLSDYNITIPAGAKSKVANTIKITIETSLEPLKA